MTLLNCDIKLYKKKLLFRKILAVAVFTVTAILNLLLTLLRTDATHTAFLAIIIIADIACGWFLIAWYSFAISMQSKVLHLACSEKNLTQSFTGIVTEVSENTQMVAKFSCHSVRVDDGEAGRTVFTVSDGGINLEVGASYAFTVVDNIVIVAGVKK